MAYPSIAQDEYIEEGKRKGLIMLGEAPISIRDKVDWECERCHTIHRKSLRAVRQAAKGCSCRNPDALQADDYAELATRLGIEWVGIHRPRNTKVPTYWRNPRTGAIVEASFYELGYHHIRRDLRDALGIIVWIDLPQPTREVIRRLAGGVTGGDNDRHQLAWLVEAGVLEPVSAGQYELTEVGERLLEESNRDRSSYPTAV